MSACDNIQSNQIEVLIAKQAVCGAPDAAPVFKAPNRTDGIYKKTNSFFQSAEVKKSRQARKQILDNKDFAAEFPFELTSDIARYLEEGLYSEFTAFQNKAGLDLNFDATANTISDNGTTGVLGDFVAGQFVFVPVGIEVPATMQYYVESVIDADTLQIKAGNILITNASVITDISGSMLRSGSTRKYLTVQNRYPRASAPVDGADFETLVNAVVNSVSLALGTSGAVTGTLSLIGGTEVDGLAKLDSQTDLASDDECPVSASGIVSDIWIDFNQTDAGMSDATIDFGNNVTATPRAGKRGSHTMSEGDITCTGSLNSIPTKTNILAEKTKSDNVVQFSLTLPFELEGDRKLFFTLRNCIYTDVTMNASGNELMLNSGTYAAQEDVYGCTLQVDANWDTSA
mgnify:CR=1 FL=1|tara:strand:+ start:1715 stop:2917 length:1203 start_codon:yes stop_codon:yes gene_type:complete